MVNAGHTPTECVGISLSDSGHRSQKSASGINDWTYSEIIADDPETQHDFPLLIDRTGHELLETREEAGEFFFLVKVLQDD